MCQAVFGQLNASVKLSLDSKTRIPDFIELVVYLGERTNTNK